MKSFSQLPLSQEMLKNLDSLQYKIMTDIQEASIPEILKGRDILAKAKTGSGKTAAFGIGMLETLNLQLFRIQALILCPTRELAEQVSSEVRRLARFKHNIKLLKLTGGMPLYKQEHSLRHEAHVVVGTPGRVMKLLSRGSLVLDHIKMIILDEADRMLDMGFIDQIDTIMEYAPQKRQTLCFSATFPEGVKKLSLSVLNNPQEITVESEHKLSVIKQYFFQYPVKNRENAVITLMNRYPSESTIIFCNTKEGCRQVHKELKEYGVSSLALHGDLEQKERTEVLIRFANRSCNTLIATDVAARGLDINNLGCVINYDMPFETETYIHRIGRTGRAGKNGLSLSIVSEREYFRLKEINNYLKSDFTMEELNTEQLTEVSLPQPPMVTLSINGGRRNKISAGDILGTLTAEEGIAGSEVGKIDRLDYITFVAVAAPSGEKARKIMEKNQIKGRRFKVMIHDL